MSDKRVPIRDVLVVSEMDYDTLSVLADKIQPGTVVINLVDGQTLDSLDEDDMRRAGWCRCD